MGRRRIKLLVGTKNRRKGDELSRLLVGLPVEVLTLADIPGEVPECVEEGETFLENASAKALHYAKATGLLCVADDSGLCVDALDGEPGVVSARYAGDEQNDEANIRLLLERLEGVPYKERTAHFVCAVALAEPERVVFTVQGVCFGRITERPAGSGGFGYDPVFVPIEERRTFAEMSSDEKDKMSHRGRALFAFRDRLLHYLQQKK